MFITDQLAGIKSQERRAPARVFNVSRRDFLKRSGLALGTTFVLGVVTGCKPVQAGSDDIAGGEPGYAEGMADAAFQPNLFVGLHENGDVFIVCSRSEMGQGIRTGMPPVIADEMEADWGRVKVVQADGDAAYGNQNTDGSRSVRNHFEEWRQAGATARLMLIQAAAKIWEVDPSECTALNHEVVHEASERRIGYGELAATAADLEVPLEAPKKSRAQWRYIGKEIRGVDNQDIGSGKAIFGIDAIVPGMRHASILRSPVIGGKLKSHDASAALAVPGVLQVVELPAADFPLAFKALGGLAVVAENTWAALQGRKALVVEWDTGANISYTSESYRENLKSNVMSDCELVREQGDVSAALTAADQTVEATYFVPMLAHTPMEPPNALAWVKEDGSIEIWAPTQAPQVAMGAVAAALGVEADQVTMHVTFLGGGFGRKSKPDYIVEAALVSREVGAPVKLTWTREDDVQFGYFHAPSMQHLKAGLDADGNPTAWLHRTAFPSISSTFANGLERADAGELGLGFTTVPYDIPNMRLENGEAEAHVRIGWLRSVSNIHHAFAINAFAGEVAHAAGRDQKDYLLQMIGPGRVMNDIFEGDSGAYGEDLEKQPYDTARLRNVIELVAEKAGWGKTLPEGHGLGIAAHFSFVSYVAHVVQVSVEDGELTIHRIDSAIDCGTYINEDRVRSQMEGAVVFGLSHALHGGITARDGAVEQSNFHDNPLLRLDETPEIHVHIVESELPPGGVGEPGLPSVAPAVTNAILSVTGVPVRELPIKLA